MQGFLPCFTSEVFWSRHLPSCLWHFKHRMVAAFAWTCIGFSYFHSLPHCPKKSPFWVASDSNMCLCFLALVLSLCLFHHIGLQGQKRRNLCKSLWSQKSKVICISASEIHWMELGKLWSHPTADRILLLSALDCAVNWHFIDSTSLQSPFLYNFNSSAWISHFYCLWLYSSAQPIFEKQCHALLWFLFYSMSYLIPILPLQTQLG